MIDDAANDEEIMNEILGVRKNREKFTVPEEDMIEFLRIVSKRQVVMEPEADEMLRDYFTATRMIRESETIAHDKEEQSRQNLNFRFSDTESARDSAANGRVARETLSA